jgi:hypothetical protein
MFATTVKNDVIVIVATVGLMACPFRLAPTLVVVSSVSLFVSVLIWERISGT